jgi:hypothetical protein
MGLKLTSYLQYARDNGGALAKARVVMISGITDNKAAAEPDSPENITKLRSAIKEVTGADAPNL